MKHGIPLNDEDRRPWLFGVHLEVWKCLASGIGKRNVVIVACSALKLKYRELLMNGDAELCENEDDIIQKPNIGIEWLFVNLEISKECATRRLSNRSHFMNPNLVQSQFDTLELTPFDSNTYPNAKFVTVNNEDNPNVVQDIWKHAQELSFP